MGCVLDVQPSFFKGLQVISGFVVVQSMLWSAAVYRCDVSLWTACGLYICQVMPCSLDQRLQHVFNQHMSS